MLTGRGCGWRWAVVPAMLAWSASSAVAQMRITEYMYTGAGAEFIEFTNVGLTSIDMTGWSYDDIDGVPGSVDLSAFGVVNPGESVILCEVTDAAFRADWNLPLTVDIIGGSVHNLGRNDTINLYDNTAALVDTLAFGDQTFPGTIRTQNFSGWACAQAVGINDIFNWTLSVVSDLQNSYTSTGGDVGNPGTHASANSCARIRITEYMYSGNGAEFMEFTNRGTTAVDMTGWSYSDEDRIPGTFALDEYAMVAAGEVVILCEATEANFRANWNLLPLATKVIDELTDNLGRNDEINIYDANDVLVDRLNFGDQEFVGSFRTQNISAWPCVGGIGIDDVYKWFGSVVADVQSSYLSVLGDIGNPGSHVDDPCPAVNVGACCSAGVCTVTSEVDCTGVGLYQGDGTGCEPNDCPAPTNAEVRITEFMHGGDGLEFIEFTNVGLVAVDVTGWSYTDSARVPGDFDISGFGVLDPGESVVLSEAAAAAFDTYWGLAGAVSIIGSLTTNINNADECNIYDNSGALVDRINFGVLEFPGSINPDGTSGWVCAAGLGADDIYQWKLSSVGDAQASFIAPGGTDTGNPGSWVNFNCPPPIGACCVNAVCTDSSPGACAIADGLYGGDGTNCVDDPCPAPSDGAIRITEYMYTATGGEFVEFTNRGTAPVDMTGWSYTDSSAPPGLADLSAFGMVDPGEVVLLVETDPGQFAADWGGLANSIIRMPSAELGRNDTIRLFDSSGTLHDVLQYGDEDIPGSIRTQIFSGWPCPAAVGADNILDWGLSAIGDEQNSFASANIDVGNPGTYLVDPCDDGDSCTWDQCAGGACTHTDNIFGDVNHDGTVDIFDILCVLDGFSGVFAACTYDDVNIAPCTPDVPVDIFDILAVLDAFSGLNLCNCPAGPTPAAPLGPVHRSLRSDAAAPRPVTLRLIADQTNVRAGSLVTVHVVADGVTNLRGYQLSVDIGNARHGALHMVGAFVDASMRNYVFAGRAAYQAGDTEMIRLANALSSGSASADRKVYLGSFAFQASPDAFGAFALTPRTGTMGTVLVNSDGNIVPVIVETDLVVRVR